MLPDAKPTLRPELTTLPYRMAKLHLDARGYPVPAFVEWVRMGSTPLEPLPPGHPEAYPEFRMMRRDFWVQAIKRKLCWVCAEPLGVYRTFVVGPMCGLNRTSSEPPSHYDCAVWSAINCPFLSRPHAVRREDEATAPFKENVAGEMLPRNPGVTMLWTTRTYTVFDDGSGKPLIEMGEPMRVEWYSQGRRATRTEVVASIASGLPLLEALVEEEETPQRRADGHKVLHQRAAALAELLPPVAVLP